jgi:hypothetical protein
MEPDDPRAADEVLLTERTGHVLVLTLTLAGVRRAPAARLDREVSRRPNSSYRTVPG